MENISLSLSVICYTAAKTSIGPETNFSEEKSNNIGVAVVRNPNQQHNWDHILGLLPASVFVCICILYFNLYLYLYFAFVFVSIGT